MYVFSQKGLSRLGKLTPTICCMNGQCHKACVPKGNERERVGERKFFSLLTNNMLCFVYEVFHIVNSMKKLVNRWPTKKETFWSLCRIWSGSAEDSHELHNARTEPALSNGEYSSPCWSTLTVFRSSNRLKWFRALCQSRTSKTPFFLARVELLIKTSQNYYPLVYVRRSSRKVAY